MDNDLDYAADRGRNLRLRPKSGVRGNIGPIGAVMISATIYTVVQGLTYPLLALRLNQRGIDEWAVGLNAAMMPAGMLAAAIVAPRLVGVLGLYRLCLSCLFAVSACLLAIGIIDEYWAWLPLRFVMGVLLACIFVVTDTWVNHLVDNEYRGRALGIYSMLLSVGFAIGPAILASLGSAGFAPIVVGAALPLAAMAPLIAARRSLRGVSIGGKATSVLTFARRAPTILACVVAAAFADQAAMSLLPIYALDAGYGDRLASLSLTAMIVGSIALMYPIGWLADRLSRTMVTTACAVATLALSALMHPAAASPPAFLFVIFLWGGIYYAIYTLALVRLGQQFSGADLVAGSAACGATWGLGGFVGTPLAGAAMERLGPAGFPAAMVAAFALLSIVLLLSRKPNVRT
jgi:MFS family permease